jgi:hypothetical protein
VGRFWADAVTGWTAPLSCDTPAPDGSLNFEMTSDLSIAELTKELERLESVDSQAEPADELLATLRKIHDGFNINAPLIPRGTLLYRAVKVEQKPRRIARISYPPSECVRSQGRANEKGQVMFYASIGARDACLFESDYQPGDTFAVSEWETTDDLLLNHLGYSSALLREAKSNREDLPKWAKHESDGEKIALLRDWQSRVFMRKASYSAPAALYRMSIALSKLALDQAVGGVGGRSFAGIMYPSVAMWMNGDNVALLPSYVDSSLVLRKVDFILVSWRADPEGRVETVDTATSFLSDGWIGWNGESTFFSVPTWR